MHWKPLSILSFFILTGFVTCEKCGPQCTNGGHVEEKNYEEQHLKSSCECGMQRTSKEENEPVGRVIAGDLVKPKNKYPWMISIEFSGIHFCGASILTSRYVLTAAHCLLIISSELLGDCFKSKNGTIHCPIPLHGLKLRYFEPGGQKEKYMSVSSYKFDGRYNDTTYNNQGKIYYDIALMKTAEALPCSEFTAPICLPRIGDELYQNNSTATIAGWGVFEPGPKGTQSASKLLREGSLIISNDEKFCKRNISTQKFCALGIRHQNACFADSGGPLFKEHQGRHYVIGIVSFGDENCTSGAVEVYTKVSTFLPWIKKHMDPKSKLGPNDREIKE